MKAQARVDDRWTLNGLATIILENELIRTSIIADMGANIHEFIDKRTGRDFLFHHPRVQPRTPVYGEVADNRWTGGVDEIIPTGWQSEYKGDTYPSVGEVYALPWNYEIVSRSPEEVGVRLWVDTVIAPLRVERWVYLRPGETMLRMRHRVTNLNEEEFPFLWGFHNAFDAGVPYRVDLPGGTAFVEHYGPAFFGQDAQSYHWPHFEWQPERTVDMRLRLPDVWPAMQLHYIMATDGWLAFTDLEQQAGIGMAFPQELFPVISIWFLWGWRGIRSLAIQPWTGYPPRLHEAVSEKGLCATLAGGETLECETRLVIYKGMSHVTGIDMEGQVSGTS